MGAQNINYDVTDKDGNYLFYIDNRAGGLSIYEQVVVIPGKWTNDVSLKGGVANEDYIIFGNEGSPRWFTDSFWWQSGFYDRHVDENGKQIIANDNASFQPEPRDGRILNHMGYAHEFITKFYHESPPFLLPQIVVERLAGYPLSSGYAGQFVPYDPNVAGDIPKIWIHDDWTDITTCTHEYGHYVQYKMYSNTVPPNQTYSEGFAVFHSFCVRNYANRLYGAPLRKDDNSETGPYTGFVGSRYTTAGLPAIDKFAAFLWNLYDGYSNGVFEAAQYDGDNDDIRGQSRRVFDKINGNSAGTDASYLASFKSGLDDDLILSIDKLHDFDEGISTNPVRPPQVCCLTYQNGSSAQQIVFSWSNQSYPSGRMEANFPTGYKIYKNVNNSWQLVSPIPIPFGSNSFTYNSATPAGQYKITSYNASGEAYNPWLVNVGNVTVASTVTTGWNMVSVPNVVSDFSKTVVYLNALSSAFSYSSSGYSPQSTLMNGLGYQIKYNGTNINYTGPQLSWLEIPVVSGWNMIGSISTSIPVSSIIPSSGTEIKSWYFTMVNGAYQRSLTIDPGKGYWVKTSITGTTGTIGLCLLTSPGNEIAPLTSENPPAVIPTPPPPTATTLSCSNCNTAGAHPQLSWTATANGGTYKVYRAQCGGSGDDECYADPLYHVVYNGSLTSYSDNGVTVYHKTGENPVPESIYYYYVTATDQFSQVSPNSNTLDVGSSDGWISKTVKNGLTEEGEQTPKEYGLFANYPNPFNPTTTIYYTLPEDQYVKLVVYNVLGEEVARLVDGVESAGYKTATFDASNLQSGVYYYRLTAGRFEDVKKMLLVK